MPDNEPDHITRMASGDAVIEGCLRCGQWDRDEGGKLMCCCPPEVYRQFHPPRED